jgi:hypothetical protein
VQNYVRNKSKENYSRKLRRRFFLILTFFKFPTSGEQISKNGFAVECETKQTRLVPSEETLHGTGARQSVSMVVTGDQCIHIVRSGGHKITSLETIPITSCAKTPGGKPCSEGTVCNYLCEEVCNGYVNKITNTGRELISN